MNGVRFVIILAAFLSFQPNSYSQFLYGWGDNSSGQLGNNSFVNSGTPVPVFTSGVLSGIPIARASNTTASGLALGTNGRVYAWGDNSSGTLGNGNLNSSQVPVAVSTSGVLNNVTITRIAGGDQASYALGSNGRVYSWGNNSSGQLGNGSNNNSNLPVAVDTTGALNGINVTQIAAGRFNAYALGSNGRVYSWGSGIVGALGNGSFNNDSNVPIAVDTSGVLSHVTVTSVSAGLHFAIALGSNGRVYSWGNNVFGHLGNNSVSSTNLPVAVDTTGVLNGVTITQISAGNAHSLALGSNGRVYSWGYNIAGQLGNGSNTNSLVPVAINSNLLNSLTVTQIATTNFGSYALTNTGRLFAWGDNGSGGLGQGTIGGTSLVPVEVMAPAGLTFSGIYGGSNGSQIFATVVPEPCWCLVLVGLTGVGIRRFRIE